MTRPSRDARRPPPILNVPGVVSVSCLVLLALYALYAFASLETQAWVIAYFAFVPARMAIALDLARPALRASVQDLPQETFAVLIGSGAGRWWSLVTYALLHGSPAHVALNCVWLVVFGSPVARRLGAARFLVLGLVAIVAGALGVFLWSPASFVPIIGASAAVAGMAGAAARFVFSAAEASAADPGAADPGAADPGAALAGPPRHDARPRQPALTLAETFTNRAGFLFIVLFLGTQVLTGLVPEVGSAPIAWQGHIGGFLAGLVLFPLFDQRRLATPGSASADPSMDENESAGSGETER